MILFHLPSHRYPLDHYPNSTSQTHTRLTTQTSYTYRYDRLSTQPAKSNPPLHLDRKSTQHFSSLAESQSAKLPNSVHSPSTMAHHLPHLTHSHRQHRPPHHPLRRRGHPRHLPPSSHHPVLPQLFVQIFMCRCRSRLRQFANRSFHRSVLPNQQYICLRNLTKLQFCYLASGTVAIIWRIIVGGNCDDEFYWNGAVYNISFVACNIFSVIAGLSFFNVALLCFWFGLLVRRARNTPGLYPRQAYGVPAHRLIVGDVNREGMYQPASLGGAFDVRAADAEMGMVNPFANTRQPVSVPRQSQMFAPPSGTPQRGAPLFARRETTEITSLTPPLNVKRWSDRSDAGSAVRLLAEQPEHRSLEESSRRSPNGSKAGSPEGLGHPTYGLP